MKKGLFLLVILIVALVKITSAEPVEKTLGLYTQIYGGYRQDTPTVGQQFKVYLLKDLILHTNFESYINNFQEKSFTPHRINYTLGLQYKQVGWEHQCLHDIDQYDKTIYPKLNRFSFSW